MDYIDETFLLSLIKKDFDDAKKQLYLFDKYNVRLTGKTDSEGNTLFHYMAVDSTLNEITINYLSENSSIVEIKNNLNKKIIDIANEHKNHILYSILYCKRGYTDITLSRFDDSIKTINEAKIKFSNNLVMSGGDNYIQMVDKKLKKNKIYKDGDNKLLARAIYQVMIDRYGKYKENKINRILNKDTKILNRLIINFSRESTQV